MVRTIRSGLAVLASMLLACGVAAGQRQRFQANPSKSQVQFTLEATLHAVHGSFRLGQAEVTFAPDAHTMSGVIAVDAHSGSSGETSRDKKMTQDELKADKYTAVTFVPKSYTGELSLAGDSDITVQGTFTLLGTPHDLSLPMHVHVDHQDCTAKGSFPVPFVAWGLKDPSTFLLKVGKEVTINLDLVGTLAPAAETH